MYTNARTRISTADVRCIRERMSERMCGFLRGWRSVCTQPPMRKITLGETNKFTRITCPDGCKHIRLVMKQIISIVDLVRRECVWVPRTLAHKHSHTPGFEMNAFHHWIIRWTRLMRISIASDHVPSGLSSALSLSLTRLPPTSASKTKIEEKDINGICETAFNVQ